MGCKIIEASLFLWVPTTEYVLKCCFVEFFMGSSLVKCALELVSVPLALLKETIIMFTISQTHLTQKSKTPNLKLKSEPTYYFLVPENSFCKRR